MRRLLHTIAVLAAIAAVPALADGLSRFEQEIKPNLGKIDLTYRSATAIGPTGFALNDVRAVLPGDTPDAKPTPVQAKRIVIEDIDLDPIKTDDAPHFLRMRIEGATATGQADDWRRQYGIPEVPLDFAIDYRLDAARKVFTLNRLELALPGLVRIELGLILDGVTPASFKDTDTSKDDVSLRTATLVYEDSSFLAKLLPALAAEQKKTAEALVAESLALLGVIASTQSPKAVEVFDVLASFISDFRQLKGPLRLTVSPPKNLSTADMDKIEVANAIIDIFGLSATYAGTRPGAALAAIKPAPDAKASAGTASGTIACKPGQRLFALADGGWWSATVREATQSGQRCVVRLEGSDGDDDVVIAAGDMMAWSIDGPGEAAKSCRKGDRVWIKSEGAWFPAKVRQTARPGAACIVRLEGEDEDDAEDETVELKRVRVIKPAG